MKKNNNMNKKPCFLIPFIVILTLLTAIMLQSFFPIVTIKPLNGFTKEAKLLPLTRKSFLDGSYQENLTQYAKQHTGFREFFIRSYNQLSYSVFDKITNNAIIKGENSELYLIDYVNVAIGKHLVRDYGTVEKAKADAEKNVEATLAFIDTLHQHGTDFLFVFCPSKPAVYPEYMPKAYRNQISDFQLEEYYIQLFKEKGIPHIDFYHYFQDLKDTFPYPLYAKPGTHWAESTTPYICDSILRKIEEVTGHAMPSVTIDDLNLTTDYTRQDGELEANLNLLFPLPKPALPKPVFHLDDTVGKVKPNLLVIGDSYFVQLKRSPFSQAFNELDFWMYNKTMYSTRPYYNGKQMSMVFDANEILEEADLVVAMVTSIHQSPYLFNFIPFAEDLFIKQGNSDAESIAIIIQNIKSNTEWYQKIAAQAESRGITVEENLRINAEYVLESSKQKKAELSKE
ncbi:MAG: hypothetical protein K6G25_01360 [Bacteroidales bacterium]|nr:hypothetical protein [Bacteroidales bacterium]